MQSILRISVASCQHYEQGYFHAYRDMVSRGSDLIIHLGDYIYEGNTATPVRAHDSNVECKTLADYRRRYAWYRADPLLQEAHAHCPWLVTHDDHELDNDYADLQSENPAEQAEFAARRAVAYQAYWENMPLPLSAKPQGPDMALYMSRQFGDLLAIHMLDERQYRSPQACPQPPRRGGTRVIVEQCADWRDPDRTILGSAQEQWLAEQLATSKTRWNLLGQGVVFTWIDEDPGPKTLNWNDSWAGYPAARRRMLETISTSGASNPVILGGDIHAFIAGDQRIDPRDPKSPIVTSEFVTTSVTSGPPPKKVIEAYNRSDAIGVHYAERDYRGYLRLEVSAERLNAEMIGFASVRENEASPTTIAKFVIDDGQRGIQRL
jgi:alkaline phosphatase D